jgi:hypothetical protein
MVIKMQKENIYTYWHSWIYIELCYYKSNKMVRQVILYILYLVLLQFQIPWEIKVSIQIEISFFLRKLYSVCQTDEL